MQADLASFGTYHYCNAQHASYRAGAQACQHSSECPIHFRLEQEIEQLQQQRDSINRQRKLTQESDGRALQQMEQQYKVLVAKNMEINMACQELESEVSQLQEETGQSDASSQDT